MVNVFQPSGFPVSLSLFKRLIFRSWSLLMLNDRSFFWLMTNLSVEVLWILLLYFVKVETCGAGSVGEFVSLCWFLFSIEEMQQICNLSVVQVQKTGQNNESKASIERIKLLTKHWLPFWNVLLSIWSCGGCCVAHFVCV